MAEHPILFNGEMVRAILDGRKAQTRRVMKPQPTICRPSGSRDPTFVWYPKDDGILRNMVETIERCPYGQPGDVLAVKETWRPRGPWAGRNIVQYRADSTERSVIVPPGHVVIVDAREPWKSSATMPRWASRITLGVLAVRVERVQEISEESAKAEGCDNHCPCHNCPTPPLARFAFREVWDSINAKRGYGWESNPWVWVVEFKRQKPEGD